MFCAAPAAAHLGHVVLSAERYLKIDVSAAEARLVVSLTLGPEEGRRVLEAADADGDRTVTRAEADAYMAEWGAGLEVDLPVHIDGSPVEVRWGEPYLDPVGQVRPVPVNVEMVAHIPLEGGRHTVSVVDRMRREVFDRTDVAFRARDGAELVASGMTAEPTAPVPALAYGPDLPSPDGAPILTAIVEVDGPPDEGFPWLVWALAGTLLLVAGLAWLSLARRR